MVVERHVTTEHCTCFSHCHMDKLAKNGQRALGVINGILNSRIFEEQQDIRNEEIIHFCTLISLLSHWQSYFLSKVYGSYSDYSDTNAKQES